MRLAPGSVVADRYRLTRLLGEGGMGDVWEATHVVTGRAVAIKRLRLARDADPGSVGRARFVLEAQAACAVEHPNVVEILDFVESGDEPPIIVMELLRGETLAARLEREQVLDVEQTARLLLPVVSAVGTAHSRGIVHRDLKPANIFLQASGEELVVKVLDFGIAKWAARPAESPLRTETGSTLGTPCYMAPEQALGERVIDQRADVWALGVMLYECLSGMRPVEGENAARIMVRLMSTGIMPIERLVPSVPAALAELVTRMLSREPAERPSTLREVRAVLAPLTRVQAPDFGEPRVELAPSTLGGGFGHVTTAPPLTAPRRTPPPEPAPRQRPRLVLAVALFAAALLTSAGWGLRSLGDTREASAPLLSSAPARGETPLALAAASPAPPPVAVAVEASPPATASVAQASPGATARRAPAANGSVRSAAQRSPVKARGGNAPVAAAPATPPAAGSPRGLGAGAACERSRDCESRLCLAFVCH